MQSYLVVNAKAQVLLVSVTLAVRVPSVSRQALPNVWIGVSDVQNPGRKGDVTIVADISATLMKTHDALDQKAILLS